MIADPDQVEDDDPGTAARPEGQGWYNRRAKLQQERKDQVERDRQAVLSRIPPEGRTLLDLVASLQRDLGSEWTSATTNGILAQLVRGELAHPRDGVWFRGTAVQASRPPAVAAAPAQAPDPEARVLEVVAGGPWWFRTELAAACHPVPFVRATIAIASLVQAGKLEQDARTRVRVPRKTETESARSSEVAPRHDPTPPRSSVGPARPVGGDTGSSPDPGAPAGRELGAEAYGTAAVPDGANEGDEGALGPDHVEPGTLSPADARDRDATGAVDPGPRNDAAVGAESLGHQVPASTPPEVHSDPDPSDDGAPHRPAEDGLTAARTEDLDSDLVDQTGPQVVTGGGSSPAVPSERAERRGRTPTRDRVVALVHAEPGIETSEVARRLDLNLSHVGQVLRQAGLRRTLDRDPDRAEGRGATIARWYPAKPTRKGTDRAQILALVEAEPGLSSAEIAQRLGLYDRAVAAECGRLGFRRVLRTREDQPMGRLGYRYFPKPSGSAETQESAPQAEPGSRPVASAGVVPAEPAGPALPRDTAPTTGPGPQQASPAAEQPRSPDPEPDAVSDAAPGGPGSGESGETVPILVSAYIRALDKLGALERENAELRARVEQLTSVAGDLSADLERVADHHDRMGIPSGDLGWRLGWIEGRRAGRTG